MVVNIISTYVSGGTGGSSYKWYSIRIWSSTSSGALIVSTYNSGTSGVSGKLSFTSGTTSDGASGSIEIYTGDATNGEGGDILLSIGKSKTEFGGDIRL